MPHPPASPGDAPSPAPVAICLHLLCSFDSASLTPVPTTPTLTPHAGRLLTRQPRQPPEERGSRKKGDTQVSVSSEGARRADRPGRAGCRPRSGLSVCKMWVVWVSEELSPPGPRDTFLRSACSPRQSALSTHQFQPLIAPTFVKRNRLKNLRHVKACGVEKGEVRGKTRSGAGRI